jgi:hypothetical protein
MQTFEATLVGLSAEFTADGGPVEISGALFAKAFTRERIEMDSNVLFGSDTPVVIEVGKTLAIGSTARVSLAHDSSEIAVAGENLGLGGQLSIGGPRHLIIPSFYMHNTETGDRHELRFSSDDGTQHVRADFIVKLIGGLL